MHDYHHDHGYQGFHLSVYLDYHLHTDGYQGLHLSVDLDYRLHIFGYLGVHLSVYLDIYQLENGSFDCFYNPKMQGYDSYIMEVEDH